MTAESGEVLSSLTDGVAVDPDRLEVALGEPGATSMLVEFARLRVAVESVNMPPGEGFYRSMDQKLSPPPVRLGRVRWTQLAAAALVPCAIAMGIWVGRVTAPSPQAGLELAAYCADSRGALYAPGRITAVDNRRVECVLKGEWQPVAR